MLISWRGIFVGFFCLSLAALASTAGDADTRSAALLSITSEEIKRDVSALADDTFEGREAGSRGGRAAGIFIVDRLKKAGLIGAAGKDGFYQHFGNYTNILTRIEGSEPPLSEEVIVIGAHYDHVGYGSNRNSYGPIGLIHNGADDNASGVAGLLEIAEALTLLPRPPRRSILIAFWDGEEKGLLGSQYWVDHPTVPLARIPIAINLDMIGRLRNHRLEVFGVRTAPGLRRLLSQQNDAGQLVLDFNWELKPDSDHHSFVLHNIPIIMPFTGLHNDYHRPSDDAEKVNPDGIRLVTRLALNLVLELADGAELGKFRRQSRSETRADQKASEAGLSALPGRLGIRWDEGRSIGGAIVVAAVVPGTAAERAGIRAGDKIIRFANSPIENVDGFRASVLAARNPAQATIERPGVETPLEISLQLSGEPARLGIAWRTDDAEPGCVILNRVTSGSLAERAGLQVNDRIYRVAGRDIANGEEFGELVRTTTGPLTLEVESWGRIRNVEIMLLKD